MSWRVKPAWPFVLNRDSRQAVGLVGWWPGILPGCPYWHDVMGHATYRGVLTAFPSPYTASAGWAAGKDGGRSAVRLNGSQYVAAVRPTFTNAAYSIAIWANWTTTGTTSATIQNLFDNNHGSNSGFTIQDRPDIGKCLSFYTGDTGGIEAETTFQVGDGTWRHIVCTYSSASGGQAKIYINGQLNVTVNTIGTGILQTNLTWGQWQAGASRYLTGLLEEPRVYNRVLSAADVWAMYDPRTRWELRHVLGRKTYLADVNLLGMAKLAGERPSLAGSGLLAG